MFGRLFRSSDPPSDCNTARDRLQRWLDEELQTEEAAHLQSHLATCPACAAEAQKFRSLARMLRRELEPRTPLPAGAVVIGQILEQSASRSPWRKRASLVAIPALAVLVAALILPALQRPLSNENISHSEATRSALETAHLPVLVVLEDEQSGRQVLLAPATSTRRGESLNP